jgi:hypothetical protein
MTSVTRSWVRGFSFPSSVSWQVLACKDETISPARAAAASALSAAARSAQAAPAPATGLGMSRRPANVVPPVASMTLSDLGNIGLPLVALASCDADYPILSRALCWRCWLGPTWQGATGCSRAAGTEPVGRRVVPVCEILARCCQGCPTAKTQSRCACGPFGFKAVLLGTPVVGWRAERSRPSAFAPAARRACASSSLSHFPGAARLRRAVR